MDVSLEPARSSLARTPAVLATYFVGLHSDWNAGNEGPGTWSPLETLTHLVHVESSWMARMEHIAKHGESAPFPLVDRTDHMEAIGLQTPDWLLARFSEARSTSLDRLDAVGFQPATPGLHRELGPVTMGNLLAAWTTHDLNHLGQIVKTMAKQYRDAIGPWRRFLAIVDAQ